MSDEQDEIIKKLNAETAKLHWNELERHFARGSVIKVVKGLDLIRVAAVIAADDKPTLEQWLEAGQVSNASTDDAKAWAANESVFWTVVVAPWVLVQEADRKLDA